MAGIRDDESQKRVGEPVIAYLVDDTAHHEDDDPVQPWRWQRADTLSNNVSVPNQTTWTDIGPGARGASPEYTPTGDDLGKLLRSYVYYEKDGDAYWARTPAIGPVMKASSALEDEPHDGRIRNWKLALELFVDSPVGGNGFRTFQSEVRARFPDAKTVSVHSGYLKVLSESGLMAFFPFLAVMVYSLWMMWRLAPGASAEATLWRNAFLSVYAVLLAINLVDTHSSDRYFWVVLSFAAVAEVWKRQRDSRPGGRLGSEQPGQGGASEQGH